MVTMPNTCNTGFQPGMPDAGGNGNAHHNYDTCGMRLHEQTHPHKTAHNLEFDASGDDDNLTVGHMQEPHLGPNVQVTVFWHDQYVYVYVYVYAYVL